MLFTRHDAGLINCIPSRVKALPFGFRHGQKMDDHMHKSYDPSSAQVWLIFLYPFISHFFKNKQKMQMIITAMLELLILWFLKKKIPLAILSVSKFYVAVDSCNINKILEEHVKLQVFKTYSHMVSHVANEKGMIGSGDINACTPGRAGHLAEIQT
jgi:hypothetical protein